MKTLRTIYKFTIASIKMYIRNKQGFFWALFLPVMIMVIFGFMNFGNAGKSNIAIVDDAKTEQSKNFISGLKKIDIISVDDSLNETDAKAKLTKGNLDLVVMLPQEFLKIPVQTPATVSSRPNAPPTPMNITVYYNEGRQQQAAAGLTVVREAFDQINHQINGMPNLFSIDQKAVVSRNLKYIDFLVPGIIAMAIMQMSVFSIVFPIVQYRKKQILKRLLVTPMKPIEFISGQVITRMLISTMQALVLLGIGIFLFHINMIGNYLLLFSLVLLGALLFISMGFAISSLAKTEESAAPVANIFIFPMLFLSGVFFPIEAMPQWLQNVSYYFPLRFLAHALRSVMTENASLSSIRPDVIGLLAWSTIMIIMAVLLFRFQEE